MGRMKDIYVAREEWANKTAMELDEAVEIVETEYPEYWRVRLYDGILITRIDDCEFVELENDTEDWVECDPAQPEERDAAIASLRERLGNDNCCHECGLPHDEPENTQNTIKENN